MYVIKIIPEENLDGVIPFLEMLNPNTELNVLKERLEIMKSYNYKCVGVYDNKELIGISGIWILYKHYVGRHIEADNVIIHPEYRGKGIGEQMMLWIFDYAKENGCQTSELNCYVTNTKGQKFWMNLGYEIVALHMKKVL
jgi:diamine N-acetyltransferase